MDTLHYLVCAANMETNYPFVPTLFEFARQIEQTGCRMAYTLDGGQTAAIAMNHTLINQVSYGSQRRISDILYFATAVPGGG
jgi:exopolysaccharide biosynthesis protein